MKEQLEEETWLEELEKMKTLPPPVIERKEQCFHKTLVKFVDDGIVYQCADCEEIFEIFGAASYTAETFLRHALSIAESIHKKRKGSE